MAQLPRTPFNDRIHPTSSCGVSSGPGMGSTAASRAAAAAAGAAAPSGSGALRDTWMFTEVHSSSPPELLTRTSWVDALVAYRQIKKGKARGNTCALYLRGHLQTHLFNLGCFIQKHCRKVIFLGLLVLSLCCIGLKTATIETDVEKLWVEEGGRLQKELTYTKNTLGEGSGVTFELVIQTPKTGNNVLTVDSMLRHQQAVQAATRVTVNMFGTEWKFKDICYHSDFPSFEHPLFEPMMEKIMPCMIITPLDCFWEGSKLLGPEHGLSIPYDVRWTNLNPRELVESLRDFDHVLPVDYMEELFDRAGINTAYQERPCLNPYDLECPTTAPNYHNKQAPHVGAELTGGCQGFATKYMQWEEDLIVGGVYKNKTNFITRGEALQSIVQLLGEKELYEYYRDHNKVIAIEWTQQKAKQVLEAWQRQMTREVNKAVNETGPDEIRSFSTVSLLDILAEFSQVSMVRVALGYLVMLVYACISLLKWTDAVQSQSGVGIAGVCLVALSVAAGLGISSVIRINFNASTTQIIPFLALGLGVDDMFLIAHTFAENAKMKDIPYSEQTGECLKRTGVSVLLTSLANICAFFMAAIIPIPALRAFSLQAAILVIFNLGTIMLVFPAVVSLDLIRREEKKVDVFCCFNGSNTTEIMELRAGALPVAPPEYREPSPPPPYSLPPPHHQGSYMAGHNVVVQTEPDGTRPVSTLVAPPGGVDMVQEIGQTQPVHNPNCYSSHESLSPPSAASSRQCLTAEEGTSFSCKDHCAQTQRECCSWSLTWFAKRVYAPFLMKTSTKIFVIIGFVVLLIAGIFGLVRVEDGLDITDIVPKDTNEYKFLDAQSKYFGFYNMYLVTQEEFDYPNNQEMLYQYHQAFQPVKNIIKKEGETLPRFWLHMFRDWLLNIQEKFDEDVSQGCIVRDQWFQNASADGILGYKLMVQTGDVNDKPYDKDRILTGRLVRKDPSGHHIIDEKAFYNYLSAWASNDAIPYVASQADFHPLPREWYFDEYDKDLKVPKSQRLVFAQIAFYLNNMSTTKQITAAVEKIRQICDTFREAGLPNYPRGIPFTFWEQYIHLRFYLMLSLMCVLCGIFLVLTVALMNPWAAVIVTAVLAMMVVELFGFMGLTGIKLSAVPAVILIVSVGIGVEFTVHVCLGFLTSIGSRDRRAAMTLEHMLAPVVHGAMSTLLGVIMLVGAEFGFIVKYFFVVLTTLVILGMLNGLILLPVLLALIGPRAEVVPLDNGDRIAPPTPEPSPVPTRPVRSISRRVYPRMPSDISLTTITEEPTQLSSHEIVVTPEVIVETSYPGGATCSHTVNGTNSNSRNTSEPSSTSSTPSCSNRHVTTVRAKATVKVEVHTPLPGCVEPEHNYKSKKKKSRGSDDPSSDSDSSSKC